MLIVDAHLDLAYNVTRGRDVLRPAFEQSPTDNEIPTVGLPDLAAGNVSLVCGTIFCAPASAGCPGYVNADEARAAALTQLDWYRAQHATGRIRPVRFATDLPTASDRGIHSILLLEGADALRTPDDVAEWFEAGLRIVGLAWRRTRCAGGTGEPGPLTAEGIALVKEMDRFGIIHDASHLAEQSFWQLMDLSDGPLMASHSNCRSIVPTDRQLTDDMIRAIGRRGGVIGINFFDKFLLPPNDYGKRRATLRDLVRHMRHMCDLIGDAKHIGLGTDMDGGLGRDQIPVEITTAADLPKVADALSAEGFDAGAIADVMSGNWLRYFAARLPGTPKSRDRS